MTLWFYISFLEATTSGKVGPIASAAIRAQFWQIFKISAWLECSWGEKMGVKSVPGLSRGWVFVQKSESEAWSSEISVWTLKLSDAKSVRFWQLWDKSVVLLLAFDVFFSSVRRFLISCWCFAMVTVESETTATAGQPHLAKQVRQSVTAVRHDSNQQYGQRRIVGPSGLCRNESSGLGYKLP